MPTDAPLLGEPAPVELMNTQWADRDGGHDALAADGALGWLAAVAPRIGGLDPASLDGLSPAVATEVGRTLRALRDALRRLAAEVTGDDRAAAQSPVRDVRVAIDRVNAIAAAAPRWATLERAGDGRLARSPASAHPPALAACSAIAEQAVELFTDQTRDQLRACPGPGCVLYFVRQHPRREWCSAGCGNRARVARHYRRHATTRP